NEENIFEDGGQQLFKVEEQGCSRLCSHSSTSDGTSEDMVEFGKGKSNDELKEMLLVADYLTIKDTLDYLAETLANRIKNKSVEYIRKFFGIENNFMPEEKEATRKEYELLRLLI
ncbi:hypothetical protein CUMW_097450, partial [Citrus unshiu]